jgi:hypothetical protein
MSQINPLLGSIVQTPQVQKVQSDNKARQIRHTQDLSKNIAASKDEIQDTVELEDPVESTDELKETRDQQQNSRRPPARKKKPAEQPHDDEPEAHLDLTA